MKLKKRHKIPRIIIIILTIIFLILYFAIKLTRELTPKINDVVIKITDNNVNNFLQTGFTKDIMTKLDIDKIININIYNKEIISVDYKLNNVYQLLGDTINNLYNNLYELKINNQYYDYKTSTYNIPIGYLTDNVLFTNIGPKIKCKVELINKINVNFKTQIKNYGINNSLMELYLVIETQNKIINPLSDQEFKEEYEILIGSRMIIGKIPDYYNGIIESSSSIVSS